MTNGQVNLQVFVAQTDIYGINVKYRRVKERDIHTYLAVFGKLYVSYLFIFLEPVFLGFRLVSLKDS